MANRRDPSLERGLTRRRAASAIAFLLSAAWRFPAAAAENPVATFPPAFPAAEWTALLGKYVDARGLVAYARWKGDAADLRRLDGIAAALGESGGALAPGARAAVLIDAYNVFIVRTIVERYPVDSIRSIPGAFTARTHRFGGVPHSLDEIEHAAIALAGYRAHSGMVCASRSCPPLDRRAWSGADLPARLDERMRAWMARPDLWSFDSERNTVRAPKYLDWYRADFERAGIARVLAAYAPPAYRAWLSRGDFRVAYLDYDWGLNDQAPPRGE